MTRPWPPARGRGARRSRHQPLGAGSLGERRGASLGSHPSLLALFGCPKASLPQLSQQTPPWVGRGVQGSLRGLGRLVAGFGGTACPGAAQRHFSCRNLNDDVIPQVGALQVTANIVFGYATWVPSPPPPGGAESPSLAPSGAGLSPPPGLSPILPPAMGSAAPSGRCWRWWASGSPGPSWGREVPTVLLGLGQHPRGLSPEAPLEHGGLGW